MKSRVHPKYKTKYRVRNWASYERALIGRGNITIWFAYAVRVCGLRIWAVKNSIVRSAAGGGRAGSGGGVGRGTAESHKAIAWIATVTPSGSGYADFPLTNPR